jgi:hypothetical protein
MSHWTKVQLKITDQDTLVKALRRMGASEVQVGKKTITQYGTSEVADVWLDNALGFKQEADGNFSMIGDFYHSRGPFRKFYAKNKLFEEELNAAYGIEDTIAKIEGLNMGFSLTGNEECEEDENGMIRLEFTSYQELS